MASCHGRRTELLKTGKNGVRGREMGRREGSAEVAGEEERLLSVFHPLPFPFTAPPRQP
jgi:hypothetical protein